MSVLNIATIVLSVAMDLGLVRAFDVDEFFSLGNIICIYFILCSVGIILSNLPKALADKLNTSISLSNIQQGALNILLSLPLLTYGIFLLVVGLLLFAVGLSHIVLGYITKSTPSNSTPSNPTTTTAGTQSNVTSTLEAEFEAAKLNKEKEKLYKESEGSSSSSSSSSAL